MKIALDRGWFIVLMLFFSTMINYFDRQALSVNGPLIKEEFGLNNEQFGFLLSVFYYTYMLMHVPFGLLLDRFNTWLVFGGAMVAWSLAGAYTGLARTFAILVGCRLALGFFEAVNWPACTKITQLTIPREQRPTANGFWNSGSMLASMVGPFIIIGITSSLNWRACFLVMGAVGLVWAAMWFLFVRQRHFVGSVEPEPPVVAAVPGAAAPDTTSPWKAIVRSRLFWGMLLVNVFADPFYHFFPNWLPTYLVEEKGVSFGQGLSTFLAIINLSMIIGINTGGPLLSLLRRRFSLMTSYRIILLVFPLLMTLVVLTNYTRSVPLVVCLVCLTAFANGVISPFFFSFIQEISATATSTVFGIISAAGVLTAGGFIWLVGYIAKQTGTFETPMVMLGAIPLAILVLYFGLVLRDPGLRRVSAS